jgi:hypothetical protein
VSSDRAPARRPGRDALRVDPGELRDTIRLTLDRELIAAIDDRRGAASRSDYIEQVLAAALEREHPHLPDGWTPERAAAARFARVQRFLATGR